MARIEHILTDQTASLSSLLAKQLSLSKEKTEQLLWLGAIYENKLRLKCPKNQQDPIIQAGTYLRVHLQPRRFSLDLEHLKTRVLDETEDLVVIDKPAGLPVHPTLDNQRENALAAFGEILGRRLFITHRLDVGTSGLLLFAKTAAEQSRLNILFEKSQVRKIYRAVVHGVDVPVGLVTHFMKPSERAPRVVVPNEVPGQTPGWLPCRMKILTSEEVFAQHSELLIELLTGRTHQIRAQLAEMGFPIRGDQMYGSPVVLGDGNEWTLQCASLQFADARGELKSYSLRGRPLPPSATLNF
jgi:23S rRNA pseudouridine1911/1915/1917 synthase